MNPALKKAIKKTAKKGPSHLEVAMGNRLSFCPLGRPEREFRFEILRQWRFDFAYPQHKIAIEVEGACWSGGRHTRGAGFIKDAEKYNRAVVLGWSVLRYTADTMNTVCDDIQSLLNRRTTR